MTTPSETNEVGPTVEQRAAQAAAGYGTYPVEVLARALFSHQGGVPDVADLLETAEMNKAVRQIRLGLRALETAVAARLVRLGELPEEVPDPDCSECKAAAEYLAQQNPQPPE